MTLDKIPTVDLHDYMHGDEAKKQAFVKALGDSFSEIGFAIVANHGVTQDTIDGAYGAFKSFFGLPENIKRQYEIPELAGQRGYISKGREHAKGAKVADLKEFFHVGQIVEDGDPIKEQYPDNIFPNEVPEVEQYGVALYQSLENSGKYLLRAIAEYLDLPVTYFDDKVHNGNSILRPIHYYGIQNPDDLPEGAVRAAAHEDINLITLLIGASADGLQVLTKEGNWLAAKPEPNQIVINVGDMLQRLTNNKLKSTTHRVINPPKEELHKPRYSVPFFLHPKSTMDLTSLASCIDADHPKLFEDMTAGEYLDQRLREIGLKK
ncbi:MAG: 2-oxoglutarate and iron-dependent oxygenase domain-containing protein [Bacteroidota bacterium]